jgi:cell division transport system permease protein
MFLATKRMIKWGWKNFLSNKESIFPIIFILFLTLFISGFLFIFKDAIFHLVSLLEEKADIAIYFKEEVKEEDILRIKQMLSQFPDIKKIEYFSKEEALRRFLEKNKGDKVYQESLEVLGENPFLASLHIKALGPFQYQRIKELFSNKDLADLIDHQTYTESEEIIKEIFTISSWVQRIGAIFSLSFFLVSSLLIINTINLAILKSKKEIEIQKIVGTPHHFIFSPFLIGNIIASLLASILAFISLFFFFYYLGPKLSSFLYGLNLYSLFVKNSLKVLFLQIFIGLVLVSLSSFWAVKHHLKI